MSDITIDHLSYPEGIHRAHAVRYEVFVVEQGYSVQIEQDNQDNICQHWVATYKSKDVGNIRLWPKTNGVAKLGRLGVLSSARGLYIGQKLVLEFIEYCKQNKFNAIVLHSQYPKRGFYEKLGFVVEEGDEIFEEAGTPHVRMWMRNL
ncbi:hypothetical protein MFLAVUS_000952 [Mucor flavus]|uniref:N-acetyltransferase domain-containing protein n=1 Tax=Mucor flavus TaxID=439312 RepID=A0ABP9YL68_9FUNG